jgi:hypothetical protein
MSPKDKIKWRIAQEAARIMALEGVHDHLPAKQKAASRLGVTNLRSLPRNEEIDLALEEYHRLYRSHVQPQHIARLRTLALEAMRFLRCFSPRLTGGVLDGSAGEFSPVTLHLFPATSEEVLQNLIDARIPFEEKTALVNLGPSRSIDCPCIDFFVDGIRIELLLFPPELKQQRMHRKDKTSMKGAIEDVEALLCQTELSGIGSPQISLD